MDHTSDNQPGSQTFSRGKTLAFIVALLVLACALAAVFVGSCIATQDAAQETLQEISSSAQRGAASSSAAAVKDTSAAQAGMSPSAVEPLPELTDAIMGQSLISADTLVQLYQNHGAAYPASVYTEAGAPTIEEWCALCAEEAEAEGVRAEVLFAQAMHETAWLQFGNQVSVEQCNFGGLGAVNSGGAGEVFPDVRTGLRAQAQHLKAYASEDDLVNECVDTRFELVERGCAPTVFDLGGRWAWPGDGYGEAIMAIIQDLYNLEYNIHN